MNYLDFRHFTRIHYYEHSEKIYTGYQLKNSSLILYSSENNEPLASLSVGFLDENNYKSDNCFITTIETPDDEVQRFQIVSTKEDVQICFTITNFCDDYMQFNLLVDKGKLMDKIMPKRLNEINILKKYQSYTVQCDYSNNNRTIILNRHINDKTNESVKFEKELENKKQVGTCIIPQIRIKNKLLTKNICTKWKIRDYIILSSPKLVSKNPQFNKIKHGNYQSKDQLIENIDMILERGDVLENLSNATEDLSCSAEDFNRTTKKNIMNSDIGIINHGEKMKVDSKKVYMNFSKNKIKKIKIGMSILNEPYIYPIRNIDQITQDIVLEIDNLIKNKK